jgi:trigger factor
VARVSAVLETNLTELSDSRVRLEVRVAPLEVQARLERKARQIGRQLKVQGFRRGKVPAPLVIQRVGREAILDEAVREALSGWYAKAIEQASVVPVGDPQIELDELPADGEPLAFSIEIGVLPKAELGEWEGLEVPRREALAEEQQIDSEIEAMRERLARLETAERPAAEGDFVVIDYVGSLIESAETDAAEAEPSERRLVAFEGGEGRDQLVELGGGNLIAGFEEALVGASAGEQREIELTFPSEYPAEQLAGRDAVFAVTVKEVKLKQLPAIDEDLAIDAGFDSVEELREDIRARLLEADEPRVEREFREAALDAAVARASVPLTPELIKARASEMWERMVHTLSHRGISRDAYLQISGREEQELLSEMEPDAERALRREAVLSAIVAAEQISPSEQELLEALEASAEREGVEAAKLLEDLRAGGRLEELREDLAARKAIELIAERAHPISPEQAQAREQLWTPGQDGEPQGAVTGGGASQAGRLWTPTDTAAGS